MTPATGAVYRYQTLAFRLPAQGVGSEASVVALLVVWLCVKPDPVTITAEEQESLTPPLTTAASCVNVNVVENEPLNEMVPTRGVPFGFALNEYCTNVVPEPLPLVVPGSDSQLPVLDGLALQFPEQPLGLPVTWTFPLLPEAA